MTGVLGDHPQPAIAGHPSTSVRIVGIGSVGVFVSVTLTLHSALDDATVDLVLGVLAILVFGYVALRLRKAERPAKGRRVGTHAR